jgi:hypothetical protein
MPTVPGGPGSAEASTVLAKPATMSSAIGTSAGPAPGVRMFKGSSLTRGYYLTGPYLG